MGDGGGAGENVVRHMGKNKVTVMDTREKMSHQWSNFKETKEQLEWSKGHCIWP